MVHLISTEKCPIRSFVVVYKLVIPSLNIHCSNEYSQYGKNAKLLVRSDAGRGIISSLSLARLKWLVSDPSQESDDLCLIKMRLRRNCNYVKVFALVKCTLHLLVIY